MENRFFIRFLTQSRVTALLLGHPLRGRPTAGGYAEAGLAICSEPSRAKRVPRDAECAEGVGVQSLSQGKESSL